MPPFSRTPRWVSMMSITGCGVRESNSVLLARCSPNTFRVFDRHDLHAQTQAQTRDVVLAGIVGGRDLAFDPPFAEATGQHDSVEVAEATGGQQALDVFCLDPFDLDICTVVRPGVMQGLDDRQVRRAVRRTCR